MRITSPVAGEPNATGPGACDIGRGASVLIAITPTETSGLDTDGRALHAVLNFPISGHDIREDEARLVRLGAGWFDATDPAQKRQVSVECDAGTYYFPIEMGITFTGGVGEWDVFVDQYNRGYPFQDDRIEFWLTTAYGASVSGPSGAPGPAQIFTPAHHTGVVLIQGRLTYNGINVTTPNPDSPLPFGGVVLAQPGTIYKTGGRF